VTKSTTVDRNVYRVNVLIVPMLLLV